MNGSQHGEDRILMSKLQRLTKILGLENGRVKMEVHQDAIDYMHIHLRVPISAEPALPTEQVAPESGAIVAAKQFIRSDLERVVSRPVNGFGRLVFTVKRGGVIDVLIVRKIKNDVRARSRRRRRTNSAAGRVRGRRLPDKEDGG
jgi:hypothetical protein